MRKLWTIALAAGLACQSWSLALAAEPTVYYQENFRNYNTVIPNGNEAVGIRVDNDPIWSRMADAFFQMKQDGLVFKDYVPAKPAADLKNYDVLFQFRFQVDEKKNQAKKFDLHLRTSGGGEVVVGFTPTAIKLSSDKITPAVSVQAKPAAEIPNFQWRQCLISVKNGALTLYVEDENRVMQRLAEAQMPPVSFDGLNFQGYKDSGFAITDILVRDPGAVPNHSVTRLLPTPPRDDAGYQNGANLTVPANDIFGATVRTGLDKDAVKMAVHFADGKTNTITFSVNGIKETRSKPTKQTYDLPDAIIEVQGLDGTKADPKAKLQYYIRPKLRRYHTSYSYTDAYYDIIRDWNLLPKASEYPVKIECRRTDKGVDVYLNGRFAGAIDGGQPKNLTFTLANSAGIKDSVSEASQAKAAAYLPLDIAALRRAKSFVDATPSLKPGMDKVKDIPMRVASGGGSADIGLTREGQGNWALEVDEYLARSAFDGLLTAVHFSVPSAPYTKAWVLVAVDPDPAKDPILTTRLAHYIENGVGNNTLADTTISLPRGDEAPGAGVTKVGTVSHKTADGKAVQLPLYLVEVPLQTGKIIDLVNEYPALDFEFFGKPGENLEQMDNTSKPDPDSTSAVQIFGVTLEKSPVTMEFVQSQPANIFANDEKPQTTAVVRSLAPAKGKLAWEIRDVDGKKVGEGSKDYSLAKAGDKQAFVIPLNQPQLGWYELLISAQDDAGHTLLTHPARFALLGPQHRNAHYDSPYGIWWFDGAHNTPKDLSFAGPIMFKAGIRQVGWTNQKEAALSKYQLFKGQYNMPFRFADLDNPEKALANGAKAIDNHLKDYPHTREILIYHESGPGNDLPVELVGKKPDLNPDQLKREKRYADLFNMVGKFLREKYPQLKTVVGNNSAAQAVVAAIFRHGGNPAYMDYIGIEAPSQVYIPEKLQEWGIQGNQIAKDTAKLLTGKDIPATGCYEFTYRCDRDMGEQQQAEWYARDLLIGLANHFTRIGPGLLFDVSNAYYNGLWGASGLMQRSPYGYPKKSYVAYATLTNVLDQVKLRQQIPTGSTTVYALEFDRPDKKIVSALWASRGQAQFNLQFDGDSAVEVIDMYGRSTQQKTDGGKLAVKAGTAPVYVVADKAITGITLGERSFPADAARAALATVVAPVDSADAVTVDPNKSLDTPLVAPLQTPIRELGQFQVRSVDDQDKGKAIELQLDTSAHKDLSKYITEYTTLRLKQPVAVPGDPSALGVWVKGNSNWGRVMFEIQDAEGETWRSIGTGGWGCDILDWPGHLSANFDGWNFVAGPLRDTKLFTDHSAGPVLEQWVSSGGNKKIDYPIKVTALIVEMNRKPLDLIDFKEANPVIRLKDLSGIAEPKPQASAQP